MSRIGAMIDHLRTQVESVVSNVGFTDVERPLEDFADHELPACMAYDIASERTLLDFRQRQEVTSITLAFIQNFQSTENALRSILDTFEAIEEKIWDENALDTDKAGFFAYVASAATGKAEAKASRYVLIMEVLFESTDIVDSNFALTEANT